MSKFIADKVYKMHDEENNTIVCFVVSGTDKYSANMSVKELRKLTNFKISVEAKRYKSKRSLEQNRLLWALLNKMAIAKSGTQRKIETEDCYIEMLEKANIESDFFLCLEQGRKTLEEKYRVVKSIGERSVIDTKTGELKILKMYQVWTGSSSFDSKQMTELIELTLDTLVELGVYDSEVEDARRSYGREKDV